MTSLCIREPEFERNALKIMQWNNNGTRQHFMLIVVVTNRKRSVRTKGSHNSTLEFYEPCVECRASKTGWGSDPIGGM